MNKCQACEREMNVDTYTCNVLVLAEKNGIIPSQIEQYALLSSEVTK